MSALLDSLRRPLRVPAHAWLIAGWTLFMIGLPIVNAVAGEQWLLYGISLGVVLQAAAVAAILIVAWGPLAVLKTIAIVAVIGWLAEFIGSSTGFPFGDYFYTDRLQPQLGHVPLVIPLAWFMLLPSAWAIADLILGLRRGFGGRVSFIALSAVAFTAWDLFLDPQMVNWELWVWDNGGGYFGIPWQNYAGWLLVSGLMTWAVNPKPAPHRPLLLIYAITWALQTIGLGLFWELHGPALVGGVVMGAFTLLAVWRLRESDA